MSTALFRICVTFPDIQIVYQSLCRWVWQVCSTSGIIPSFFNSFHHVSQSFSSVLTWLARWIISPTLFPNVVFGQTFGCVRRWPVRFLFFNVRWATLQAGQGWHEILPASLINGTGCFHNEETVWKCFRWEPMMAMNSDFYISVVQLRCWVFVLFCLALVFICWLGRWMNSMIHSHFDIQCRGSFRAFKHLRASFWVGFFFLHALLVTWPVWHILVQL